MKVLVRIIGVDSMIYSSLSAYVYRALMEVKEIKLPEYEALSFTSNKCLEWPSGQGLR